MPLLLQHQHSGINCSHHMQVLVYGDCAVNVSPSAADLANIAIASADTAAAFGVQPPRVALLSYSTGASGSGAEVEKVRPAARQAHASSGSATCARSRAAD